MSLRVRLINNAYIQILGNIKEFYVKSPSIAAQIIVAVIPIVGIVMGSAVVFFYFYWNHKQRMLMIEKGIFQQKPFDYSFFSLFAGLVISSVGVGLTSFFYVKEGVDYSLLSGIMPLTIGISLLLFFVSSRKLKNGNNQ